MIDSIPPEWALPIAAGLSLWFFLQTRAQRIVPRRSRPSRHHRD